MLATPPNLALQRTGGACTLLVTSQLPDAPPTSEWCVQPRR